MAVIAPLHHMLSEALTKEQIAQPLNLRALAPAAAMATVRALAEALARLPIA